MFLVRYFPEKSPILSSGKKHLRCTILLVGIGKEKGREIYAGLEQKKG
jgi:hypothetical protein